MPPHIDPIVSALAVARVERGLSVRRLAVKADLNVSNVSTWFEGTYSPRMELLFRALHVVELRLTVKGKPARTCDELAVLMTSARQEARLTMEVSAVLAGLVRRTVSGIERCKQRPTLVTVRALCTVYRAELGTSEDRQSLRP